MNIVVGEETSWLERLLIRISRNGGNWCWTDAGYQEFTIRQRNLLQRMLLELIEQPAIQAVYMISRRGYMLTHPLSGEGRELPGNMRKPKVFFHLAWMVEEFTFNLGHESPEATTVEREESTLYIGACGDVVLVVNFTSTTPRGFLMMKMSKYLKKLRLLVID